MTATFSPPRASARPGADGFFRHHGAWAPGIRLFRRIGFRAKAALISTAFALPLLLLGWQYFTAKQRDLDFSRLERIGVDYQRVLLPVLDALVALRGAAATDAADIGGAHERVGQSMAVLAAIHDRHATVLGVEEAHRALAEAVRALPVGPVRDAQGLERHAEAIDAALSLMVAVNDGSNLTLDPELATYYLMLASLDALPRVIAATGALHALSYLDGPDGLASTRDVITAELSGDVADARVVAALVNASRQIPDEPAVAVYADVHGALHALHRRFAAGEQGAALDLETRAVLAALVQARTTMVDTLDRLLAKRIAHGEQARGATAVALAASLGTAGYLFVAFGRVLHGGLREVARHLAALRRGDLSTDPRPWGGDEVAGLMLDLRATQDALREIVQQVRGTASGIVGAAGEVASGSQELAARTRVARTGLQASADAMRDLADSSRIQAAAAREACGIAAASAGDARDGGRVVDALRHTMGGVRDASTRIRDITATIDALALQTRILALNAAIEAARAGDHGRGFAVVASEVRALAQRSSIAAREIGQLVADSAHRVQEGLKVADDAGRTLAGLVDGAVRVDGILSEVAAGIDEQAARVARTTEAVRDLELDTRRNAEVVDRSTAAAADMDSRARRLADEVARFSMPTGPREAGPPTGTMSTKPSFA